MKLNDIVFNFFETASNVKWQELLNKATEAPKVITGSGFLNGNGGPQLIKNGWIYIGKNKSSWDFMDMVSDPVSRILTKHDYHNYNDFDLVYKFRENRNGTNIYELFWNRSET